MIALLLDVEEAFAVPALMVDVVPESDRWGLELGYPETISKTRMGGNTHVITVLDFDGYT